MNKYDVVRERFERAKDVLELPSKECLKQFIQNEYEKI
jgi:hypothetical protein